MDWNDMARRIQTNPQMLENLAQSADGQALMQRLQKNGAALEQASQSGQNGDYMGMIRLLKDVMSDSEGRKLLERMAQQLNR